MAPMPLLFTNSSLPIASVIPQLHITLAAHKRVLLVAPPGAGKSTLLPLSLLESDCLSGGEIWLLEPRRIAAEQVARRLATTLNEDLGHSIGLITGDFSKTSPHNKLVVMTEGILAQRLLRDNDIPSCSTIIFDEFHERNLQSDLGLALAIQCQEYLRDDLKLIIMSATLDSLPLVDKLGAELVESQGRSFPVEINYAIKLAELTLEQNICKLISNALNNHQGDMLVFLPGIKEISRTQQLLEDRFSTGEAARESSSETFKHFSVLPLHGQLQSKDQQAVLKPNPLRKIILATDIAKTSLTIEGVTVVIDCGLERMARFNTQNAMDELVTVQASQASMIQRAGRAGRIEAGHCYRLLSEEAFLSRSPFSQCAIQLSDLTPFALTLGSWGSLDVDDYFLLDAPDPSRYQNSLSLLAQLNGITNLESDQKTLSHHGKVLSEFPIHPRLAHMLLSVKNEDDKYSACVLAAILSEGDPLYFRFANSDLTVRMDLFKQVKLPRQFEGGEVKFHLAKRIQLLTQRLAKKIQTKGRQINSDRGGLLCMLAYPDRIAQKRGNGYRLTNGQGAQLLDNDGLKSTDFLAIAHVSKQSAFNSQSNHAKSYVRLGCELTKDVIEEYYADQITEVSRFEMQKQLTEIKEYKLGALVLSSQRIKASDEAISDYLLQEVKEKGLCYLPLKQDELALLNKLNQAHSLLPNIYPSFEGSVLIDDLENWLLPFIGKNKIKDIPYKDALLSRIEWAVQSQLKKDFPISLPLPSGRSASIDYSQTPPVIKAKLQECFGMTTSPTIAQGNITINLHLLSPAQKPLAMTHDLAFFWKEAYPEVRKENRGRYAKHPWPEDPLTAVASSKTKKRM
jgi:ATP-dependent helicase HrpB